MVIPFGRHTHTQTFACLHTDNTHTCTHTLKIHLIQGHISLCGFRQRTQGACSCCLLDISLPKGIYFILPSNPLSSQFSQDHISFLPSLFFFPETFGNVTVDLTTVLSQGNSWSTSAPPPPLPVYYVQWSMLGSELAISLASSLV